MAVSIVPAYTLAEFELRADRDVVLGLWRRNLPEADAARLAWLYERGPACGFLLNAADGECIGSCGYMRRRMRIDGVDVVAGQAVDLNVDVEHRTIGPALKLQRAVAATVGPDGLRMMYAFPNSRSEAVLRRLGYRSVGTFQRWVKLFRSESRLQKRLRSKWLTKAASYAVDAGLRLADREPCVAVPSGMHVELVEQFDERFSLLWCRASERRPIIGERTAEYLNWRYAANPSGEHRTLVLLDESGNLTAYLVYHLRNDEVSIADFLYADAAAWKVLIAEFLRRMRRENRAAVAVSFFGPTEPLDVLQQFGFRQRPSTWSFMVYSADGNGAESAARFAADRWWLTRADVDTDE